MRILAVLLLALTAQAAWAEGDALSWLQRIHIAAEKLSYSGTFVYRSGDQAETLRIVHVVGRNGAHERLETLEGQPREIVRSGDVVKCYLPGSMTVKVDKQTDHMVFPALLPANLQDLSEHYEVTKGGIERIAGYDCQSIVLQPKDKLRYGHKLWADVNTGMLLKSQTLNEKNEAIEQFAFTQITIGGKIDHGQLKSRFLAKSRAWRVENSGAVATSLAASGWSIKPELPGFKKITEMKRTQGGSSEVGHVVYSDGMAAVSVFVEPMANKTSLPQPGLSRQGAINIYSRQIAEHLVTVVGETPAESVKKIADSVGYRKP
ncbi:MAG: MucB/RseB C-terminal domain-containing protein [Betaproteobacteria bacterium]|nr:MucB/RseB C-terminal domain-containing protein [Betaproteobacteria bacterium]